MKMKDACAKCRKRKGCKVPCFPVETFWKRDNLTVFEKNGINKRGGTVQIVYALSRKAQQSTLSIGVDNRGDPRLSTIEQQAFITENENPFAQFNLRLNQTGILIDPFFHGSSYDDLALKYDMTKETAIKTITMPYAD